MILRTQGDTGNLLIDGSESRKVKSIITKLAKSVHYSELIQWMLSCGLPEE
jgi:hypothetical protein